MPGMATAATASPTELTRLPLVDKRLPVPPAVLSRVCRAGDTVAVEPSPVESPLVTPLGPVDLPPLDTSVPRLAEPVPPSAAEKLPSVAQPANVSEVKIAAPMTARFIGNA